jgi:hypothetical protein
MDKDLAVGLAVILALALAAVGVIYLDGAVCARSASLLCGPVRGFSRVVAPVVR